MYGRIHYENEAGEFRTLDCPDQSTYERELNIACKWIEAEPRRPLGMWGERLEQEETHCPDCKQPLNTEGECVNMACFLYSEGTKGTRTSDPNQQPSTIQTQKEKN
jgi:hypothetical protein